MLEVGPGSTDLRLESIYKAHLPEGLPDVFRDVIRDPARGGPRRLPRRPPRRSQRMLVVRVLRSLSSPMHEVPSTMRMGACQEAAMEVLIYV